MSVIKIVRGDIKDINVDAVIDPVDNNIDVGPYSDPGGLSVSNCLQEYLGEDFINDCRSVIKDDLGIFKELSVGESTLVKCSKVYKYIACTHTPRYKSSKDADELLKNCYYKSLELLNNTEEVKSVAVPLLSSGFNCYSERASKSIAAEAISEFINDYKDSKIDTIYLVIYKK